MRPAVPLAVEVVKRMENRSCDVTVLSAVLSCCTDKVVSAAVRMIDGQVLKTIG